MKVLLFLCFVALAYCYTGVDVSSATSQTAFSCLSGKGFSYAIVRCFRSSGSVDPNCAANVNNARAAGFTDVDVYVFPCPKCDSSAATQINQTIGYLQKNNVKYGVMWLDIEGSQYWGSVSQNQAFFSEMIETARASNVYVGVYTSSAQWNPIMGSSNAGSSYPLWYAHYDNQESFTDFSSFGGWSTPTSKQYQQNENICGAGVDVNWKPGGSSSSTASTSGNSNSNSNSGNSGHSATSGSANSGSGNSGSGNGGTSAHTSNSGNSGHSGSGSGNSGHSGSGSGGNSGHSGSGSGNSGTSQTATSQNSASSSGSGTSQTATSQTSGNTATSQTSGNTATSQTSGNTATSQTSGNTATSQTSGNTATSQTSGNTATSQTSGNTATSQTSGNTATSQTSGNTGNSGYSSGGGGSSGAGIDFQDGMSIYSKIGGGKNEAKPSPANNKKKAALKNKSKIDLLVRNNEVAELPERDRHFQVFEEKAAKKFF